MVWPQKKKKKHIFLQKTTSRTLLVKLNMKCDFKRYTPCFFVKLYFCEQITARLRVKRAIVLPDANYFGGRFWQFNYLAALKIL